MKQLALSIGVVIGLIAAMGHGNGGEKKGKQPNPDGTWILVGLEQNGIKVPAEAIEKMQMKLTLKGDQFTVTMAGKVVDKGASKLDASKTPFTVDIKSEEGPNKDKTILAIVEIDGDSMKACYDMEGKGRPTAFAAKEGSGHALILYKREAKKKSE